MYQYRANVINVHDGDTMRLKVDLGCDITLRMTVRLLGINAPELSTAAGRVARDYVQNLLPVDREVWIATTKDKKEKFGRYLGRVYLDRNSLENDIALYCINDLLLADGHAVSYMTTSRTPDSVSGNDERNL